MRPRLLSATSVSQRPDSVKRRGRRPGGEKIFEKFGETV
jgi:hypothetical protein